jgi:hypothetical protein
MIGAAELWRAYPGRSPPLHQNCAKQTTFALVLSPVHARGSQELPECEVLNGSYAQGLVQGFGRSCVEAVKTDSMRKGGSVLRSVVWNCPTKAKWTRKSQRAQSAGGTLR